MEWLRRLLGFHDRPGADGNPFGGPSWDEIVEQRDSTNMKDSSDSQHPWEHFFHGGFSRDIFSPPHDFEDPHLSVFGHMEDMFSHLEGMMRELHRHPAWALPDSTAELEPQTPRDHMLKTPDSDPSEAMMGPAPQHPSYGYNGEDQSAQHDPEDFSADPFIFSPHCFFDSIFQNFGMHPGKTPFSENLPIIGSAPDLGEHSRESLIKKEDSDIDERVSGDLSKLPEGRPGYSHELPQTPNSQRSPWSRLESPGAPQPEVRHKFYSQSIVTIRRPDGSIEETKKYTDSTGREEVTVTHKQPDGGSLPQPEGSADQVHPSIFSWFFTR